MSKVKEVKQSINKVQIVGIIKEMNLELKRDQSIKLKNGEKEKTVTCDVITKADFKKPMFLIESNGNDIELQSFDIQSKRLDKDGEVIDNDRFKSYETILNKYIAKVDCKNGEEPTRVLVNCVLGENAYASKRQGSEEYMFYSRPQFELTMFSKITSNNVPENDYAEGEISGIIRSIVPEIKNEEETGRLRVEFYSFGYGGNAVPFDFVIESDIAEGFSDTYDNGDSCTLYYDFKGVTVGKPKANTTAGFGRKQTQVVSGYTISEYSIFNGDNKFEEENEYYIDPSIMKEALQERKIFEEDKIAKRKEKDADGTTSTKSSNLNGRASKIKIEDEELPF